MTKNTARRDSGRNSGVELLKILAMLLIVLAHSTPTYGDTSLPSYINPQLANADPSYLLVSILKYGGQIGNCIFVVCSAFYLLEDSRLKRGKVEYLLMETWFFSWLWLAVVLLLGYDVGIKGVLRSFAPITLGNNWFIGCYLFLYLIHGALNQIISRLSRRQLLAVVLALLSLYSIIALVVGQAYFYSELVGFIVIYFAVAYMKGYLQETSRHFRTNLLLFLLCVLLLAVLILATNLLGLRYKIFSDQLLRWSRFSNLLIVVMSLSLFNLFRGLRLNSGLINRIASYSLPVYLLHENILFRSRIKADLWSWIYSRFSYDALAAEMLLFGCLLFALSVAAAAVYSRLLQKRLLALCSWLDRHMAPMGNRLLDWLLSIQ